MQSHCTLASPNKVMTVLLQMDGILYFSKIKLLMYVLYFFLA